jgi:hypothetical protein
MQAEVTIRVTLTDGLGRHVATVERTVRKDAGGNPRFFVSEVMPVAEASVEETVLSALRAWDREASKREESSDG